jgi:hypothetical protein
LVGWLVGRYRIRWSVGGVLSGALIRHCKTKASVDVTEVEAKKLLLDEEEETTKEG